MQPLALIDHHFGNHFSKTHALFLGYLLAAAREGHLCVWIEKGRLFPSSGESDAQLIEQAYSLPQELLDRIVVREEERWYLKRNWEVEKRVLHHYNRLSSASIEPLSLLTNEGLNQEQQMAVEHALTHPVTLVSGGPGTGKSYTAAALIRAFEGKGRVVVAAPTGKATANLRSALPNCGATTLHSLLRGGRALSADLVVVDEGSMIDAQLMATLLASIKSGARLVIFGDQDQLPPVESGTLFADLASHKRVELKRCLRAELQEIVDLATAVKRGELVTTLPLPKISELVELMRNSKAALLTPLRQGPYGVENLNRVIHEEGRDSVPIIITSNDAVQELYNGDVGRIFWSERVARFGKRELAVHKLRPYEYAYALSVHKSQGSEYEEVIILLPEGSERFGREMLYTAVTRARRKVTIYALEGMLEKVVENQTKRFSRLSVIPAKL